MFPVVSADQGTFNEAVEYVRDHSISFWDAILWVTAKQAGCAFSVGMSIYANFNGIWFWMMVGFALAVYQIRTSTPYEKELKT